MRLVTIRADRLQSVLVAHYRTHVCLQVTPVAQIRHRRLLKVYIPAPMRFMTEQTLPRDYGAVQMLAFGLMVFMA